MSKRAQEDDHDRRRDRKHGERIWQLGKYIERMGRITAKEAERIAGCSERQAYNLLEILEEPLSLFKDGVWWVMLKDEG